MGAVQGTVPIAEYFAPSNIARILEGVVNDPSQG
jgi:hypothetical protein